MRSAGEIKDPNLGKIYGHCRLERKLGEGGMGMVYLATHTTLNKLVAVKLLRSDLCMDPSAAERFLREARSAAKVEHPAVVQVYDIGHAEGTFFIVMQFVEGTTLEEYVKHAAALPLPVAYRIITAVCEGVREAHNAGVIHRDIKPDNILLGKDGSVKLADFGLARAMEGDPTISQTGGRVFGTPHFMSPEQALGEKVDHRSDIFSLGATFYRTITGQYPFNASTLLAVVFKLTHETPQPARSVNPSVPQEISDLIQEMMARNPRDRIKSMDEVLSRLKEIGHRILPPAPKAKAEPPKKQVRTTKCLRARPATGTRRQALAASLAMAVLLFTAFLVLRRYGLWPEWKGPMADAVSKGDARPEGGGKKASPGPGTAKAAAPARPAPKPAVSPDMRALKERAERLLSDVEKDPDNIARYMDPEGTHEKSMLFLQRMFSFLFKLRGKDSPPLKVAGMEILEGGGFAEVKVQDSGRNYVLRWVKRRGEWYLTPPRKRT